jgi:hypothetical protein
MLTEIFKRDHQQSDSASKEISRRSQRDFLEQSIQSHHRLLVIFTYIAYKIFCQARNQSKNSSTQH